MIADGKGECAVSEEGGKGFKPPSYGKGVGVIDGGGWIRYTVEVQDKVSQ